MRRKSKRPTNAKLVWVSLPKVAKRLSITGEAALTLVRSGQLPAKLCGARWFCRLADLDAYAIGYRRDRRGAA